MKQHYHSDTFSDLTGGQNKHYTVIYAFYKLDSEHHYIRKRIYDNLSYFLILCHDY